MPLGTEVGLGTGDFVLDGDTALRQKGRRHSPQFSAHVYCGQYEYEHIHFIILATN